MESITARKPQYALILLIVLLVFLLAFFNIFFERLKFVFDFLKPKPGDCLIVEQKYCQDVELISNPMSPDGVVAAFKLPKGTTLFSPVDGIYSEASFNLIKGEPDNSGTTYPGATILVSKDGNFLTAEGIYSLIYFGDKKKTDKPEIKKGEVLGTVSDKNVDYFGGYNLVFSVSKYYYEGELLKTANDADRLKEIFSKNN
jgi:hypothetical protein